MNNDSGMHFFLGAGHAVAYINFARIKPAFALPLFCAAPCAIEESNAVYVQRISFSGLIEYFDVVAGHLVSYSNLESPYIHGSAGTEPIHVIVPPSGAPLVGPRSILIPQVGGWVRQVSMFPITQLA